MNNAFPCLRSLANRAATAAILMLTVALLVPAGRAEEQLYTCGMHPQVIKREPGNCPICGMALTPVRANTNGSPAATRERRIKYYMSSMIAGEVSDKPGKDSMGMDRIPVYEDAADPGQAIRIDAATTQRMNIKTALVVRGPVVREFRAVGTVAYNEEGLRDITTKYEGWIEKLFVAATWTTVKTGDPLFEIYSPDLYNAQLNYVVALRTEGEAGGPLSRAALARLRLFDLPAEFIAEVASTREARRTYVFRAPADGMVIEKMAVSGQMVKPGERIYRLADLSSVWVLAQVFEQDLSFIHPGQEATVRVTYGQERRYSGTVSTLLPQVEDQTRTATARIQLPNTDGYLRPGMYVEVRFAAKLANSAVLVPDLAILRSGEHNTVFLARDSGTFEPRTVKLGARSQGNLYQVLSGLEGGEQVVTSGQFMLDSESQLRDAIQKMLRATGGPGAPASKTAPAPGERDKGLTAAVGMEEPTSLPDSERALLLDLANTTVGAAEALSADDLAGYRKALPKMRQALTVFLNDDAQAADGPLGKFRDAIPDRSDLKSARLDFAYFSTAVADLSRENHIHHAAGLHIFQCPMAPGIGTGRWLSRTGELRNPFYGSTMLECGEEVDGEQEPGKAARE